LGKPGRPPLGEIGDLILNVLGMVAQMERRFIREQQREGIKRAKGKGVYRGGQRRLDRERTKQLYTGGSSPAALVRALGPSRMLVYRIL
jgi:DNA invertase Pin-like site-specific DNA recombinase